MTRKFNFLLHRLFLFLLLVTLLQFIEPFHSIATAESPLVQGLAGAGRSGIERDPLFSNPASAAFLTTSTGFFYYSKPSVPAFKSGGRGYSVGLADGGSSYGKGAFGYTRTSMARSRYGSQVYIDRSEFTSSIAAQLFSNVAGGINVRYVTVYNGQAKTKFFQGDLGVIFPIAQDLRAGFTYENVLKRVGEKPANYGVGAQYKFGHGITIYGDLSQLADGNRRGKKSWAYAGEIALAGDFLVRGGRFYDAYLQKRGWSAGISWIGPRASIDYALRVSKELAKEKDHIFGMTVAL